MKFTQEDLKQLIKEEMAKLYEDAIEDSTAEEAAEGEQGRGELSTEHRCGSHGARDDDYVPDMECDCERCASHREGSMARAQLARASEIAMDLEKMIGEDTNLEEWVESKITKAKDYLSSVLDYMRGEDLVDAGDAARDMKAQAAAMNFGPLEEAEDGRMIKFNDFEYEALDDLGIDRAQALTGRYGVEFIGIRDTGSEIEYLAKNKDGRMFTVVVGLERGKAKPAPRRPRGAEEFGEPYQGADISRGEVRPPTRG